MKRKKYRRVSSAYLALLKYIAKYQKINGIAPAHLREIARALRTGHAQVGRLLQRAEAGGLLKKSSSAALAYEIIRTPATAAGLAWIARVDCSWTRGINWSRDEADGVWLDRAVYEIKPGSERWLWALTFPDTMVDRGAGILKLTGSAMALVRRCDTDEMQYHHWYVVERPGKEVMVSMLARKTTGKWTFRVSARDDAPRIINAKDISRVSEVLMVTMRPSPRTRLAPRKASELD